MVDDFIYTSLTAKVSNNVYAEVGNEQGHCSGLNRRNHLREDEMPYVENSIAFSIQGNEENFCEEILFTEVWSEEWCAVPGSVIFFPGSSRITFSGFKTSDQNNVNESISVKYAWNIGSHQDGGPDGETERAETADKETERGLSTIVNLTYTCSFCCQKLITDYSHILLSFDLLTAFSPSVALTTILFITPLRMWYGELSTEPELHVHVCVHAYALP